MFIARVSRGRTIREFVTGVLFVPAGFTLMWMTVFGNSAIYLIMNRGDRSRQYRPTGCLAGLVQFLEHFPFSSVLSFIAMAMVIVFFVTSADSGAMVVDTLASGGVANTRLAANLLGIAHGSCCNCASPCGRAERAANGDNSKCITLLRDLADIHIRAVKSPASRFD